MVKVIAFLGTLSLFSFGQEPIKGLFLTKAVFEERVVWDNQKGNLHTLVLATQVQKNATLIYVNQLTNNANSIKKQLVIDNPIPKGTVYLANTASCEGQCQIYYSIDAAKSFKKAEELFVVYGKRKRVAQPSEYTHIKFVFPQLVPYQKVRMGFKSRVK